MMENVKVKVFLVRRDVYWRAKSANMDMYLVPAVKFHVFTMDWECPESLTWFRDSIRRIYPEHVMIKYERIVEQVYTCSACLFGPTDMSNCQRISCSSTQVCEF